MPNHWRLTTDYLQSVSLIDDSEACGIKTFDSTRFVGLDSTRLCWCVLTAAKAIVSKPQSHCVSLTGLDWTRFCWCVRTLTGIVEAALSEAFFLICIYYFQPVFYRLGMSRGICSVFSFTHLHYI